MADDYKKIFVVRISAESNDLGSDFIEAHEQNWMSNAETEEDVWITPTHDELTDSISSEISSWLEALRFGVHVDTTEYDYLRNGLTVALNIMTDEQMREWDTDMEYKSEEE